MLVFYSHLSACISPWFANSVVGALGAFARLRRIHATSNNPFLDGSVNFIIVKHCTIRNFYKIHNNMYAQKEEELDWDVGVELNSAAEMVLIFFLSIISRWESAFIIAAWCNFFRYVIRKKKKLILVTYRFLNREKSVLLLSMRLNRLAYFLNVKLYEERNWTTSRFCVCACVTS